MSCADIFSQEPDGPFSYIFYFETTSKHIVKGQETCRYILSKLDGECGCEFYFGTHLKDNTKAQKKEASCLDIFPQSQMRNSTIFPILKQD